MTATATATRRQRGCISFWMIPFDCSLLGLCMRWHIQIRPNIRPREGLAGRAQLGVGRAGAGAWRAPRLR